MVYYDCVLVSLMLCALDSQTELHVHLYANTLAVVTIDARTGHLALKNTGELATSGRGSRFLIVSEKLNFAPSRLFGTLGQLRIGVSLAHSMSDNAKLIVSSLTDYSGICAAES